MAKGSRQTPRHQHGFVRITHQRCPACEDRGALNNEGRAYVLRGGQLRGATKDVGMTRASAGCEVCDGQGWLPVTGLESIDPYALKRTR
jgi:hypothetical protein